MSGERRVGLGVELVLATHLAAEVVDRVVATPEDAVVTRETVVVELISGVGDALAPRPPNALELLVASKAR